MVQTADSAEHFSSVGAEHDLSADEVEASDVRASIVRSKRKLGTAGVAEPWVDNVCAALVLAQSCLMMFVPRCACGDEDAEPASGLRYR